jgi:hypothetical protein
MANAMCKVMLSLLLTSVHGEISEVFVLFSTHVDLGYSQPDWNPVYNRTDIYGSKMSSVINRYFNEHFEQAIRTAEATNYTWMTQSWLVNAYRHCNETLINSDGSAYQELDCPNATALKRFEDAVAKGKLSWHALPFNAEPELYDPWLFEAALNLTFREDKHFGHAKRQTLSQRDVPGLTRATIPILSKHGVRAISVGENNAQAPLHVPPVFVWKDLDSGTEVLALFHAGGYGGEEPAPTPYPTPTPTSPTPPPTPDDKCMKALEAYCPYLAHSGKACFRCADKNAANLMNACTAEEPQRVIDYCDSTAAGFYRPTRSTHLANEYTITMDEGEMPQYDYYGHEDSSRYQYVTQSDCVEVASAGVALCYAWKLDNTGPHNVTEVQAVYEQVRALYPSAKSIVPSDAFDDFVDRVWPHRDSLPVVTAEIGDTWIYGASTDCKKIAAFRAISRARLSCAGASDDAVSASSSTHGQQHAQEQAQALPSCGCTLREMRNFERLLMVGGEHTWGSDGGGIRNQAWTRSSLEVMLRSNDTRSHDFHLAVKTWLEQRAVLENAVATLPPKSFLATKIAKELAAIEVPCNLDQCVGACPPTPSGAFTKCVASCAKRCTNAKTPNDPFDPSNGYKEVPVVQAVWPMQWVCGANGSKPDGNRSRGSKSKTWRNATVSGGAITPAAITLSFGRDGSINHLVGPAAVVWASPAARLGQLLYQGIDQDQMTDFLNAYSAGASVNLWNFGKPGFSDSIPSVNATPTITKFHVRTRGGDAAHSSFNQPAVGSDAGGGATATDFLLTLEYPLSLQISDERGVPKKLMVLIQVPHPDAQGPGSRQHQKQGADSVVETYAMNFTLRWHNKTASHAPESFWVVNKPLLPARLPLSRSHLSRVSAHGANGSADGGNGWRLHKLGSYIDPLDADLNHPLLDSSGGHYDSGKVCVYPNNTCGVHLHTVTEAGARYDATLATSQKKVSFAIQPLDSALLSVGDPIATPTPLVVPDPKRGVHFSLFNNLWVSGVVFTSG